MMRHIALPALLLLGSGCTAGLDVNVDVMNPAYARAAVTEVALLNDANELARGGHVRADRMLDASLAELEAFQTACIDEMLKAERETLARATLTQLDRSILEQNIATLTSLRRGPAARAQLSKLRDGWRAQLYTADDQARKTLAAELPEFVGLSGWESPNAVRGADRWSSALGNAVKAGLAVRALTYDQHVAQVRAEIGQARQRCEAAVSPQIGPQSIRPQTTAAIASIEEIAKENVEEAKLRSVTGGGVLLNSMTEAFFITKAGSSAWAPMYNRAVARGEMGNMSVAIKMNDTADFSIKGMVFDGRSTAEMMKKVATQTITTIAAAYGAPVSISSSTEGSQRGTYTFDGGRLTSASESTIAAAHANDQAFRSALFQIADSVAANFEGLQNGNLTADGIVRETVAANRMRWQSGTATSETPDDASGGQSQ